MPTVPLYTQSLAQESPLPGARQDAGITGDPRQMARAANTNLENAHEMQRAGNEFINIAARQQTQDNMDAITQAQTTYETALEGFKENALPQLLNLNAKNAIPSFDQFSNVTREAISKTLTNPAQQRVFAMQMDKNYAIGRGSVATFAAEQLTKGREAAFKDNIASLVSGAGSIAPSDPVAWSDYVNTKIPNAVKDQSILAGWQSMDVPGQPTHAEVFLKTVTNQVTVDRVQGMIAANNISGATAFWHDNDKKVSNPDDHARIVKALSTASEDNATMAAATKIFDDANKGANPAVGDHTPDLYAMEETARKLFPNDAKKAMDTITKIKGIEASFTSTKRTAQEEAIGEMAHMVTVQGKTVDDVKRSTVFINSSHQIQDKVIEKIEAYQKLKADRELAELGIGVRQYDINQRIVKIKGQDAYLDYVEHPEKLAAMSDAQMHVLQLEVGDERGAQLAALRTKFRDQANQDGVRIDTDLFNGMAEKLNIDVEQLKKTVQGRGKLGELRERIDTILTNAQVEQGSKLTQPQRKKIIDEAMSEMVTKKNFFGNFFSKEKEVPLLSIPKKDLPSNVRIPDAELKQIDNSLERQFNLTGDPRFIINDENRMRVYLQKRGNK